MSLHPRTLVLSSWFKPEKAHMFDQPCIVVTDDYPMIEANNSDMPLIYIQAEPLVITNKRDYLLRMCNLYTKIYTFDDVILSQCPNAVYYSPACTWISKDFYENINISKKEYRISSTLSGSKNINNAPGHVLRQILHYNQQIIQTYIHIPITFFRSGKQVPHLPDLGNNPLLTANSQENMKEPLFDIYQFAIIIENSSQINYFTEKLIDCLITKTIPIYYGCPNIHEFFDTTGWIIIPASYDYKDAISHLIQHVSDLGINHYGHHMNVIEQNYITAKSYSDYYANLEKMKMIM